MGYQMTIKQRLIVLLIALCAGFLMGFIKQIIVYPNDQQYIVRYPKYAFAGQTVTITTVENCPVTLHANAEGFEQVSATEYRLRMPNQNVYLSTEKRAEE